MNNQIIYSIIEAGYAIYMFNYFETKLTIQHPLKQFENCIVSIGDFLRHPTERSEFVENKICPIGHIVGFLFGFYSITFALLHFASLPPLAPRAADARCRH